MLSKRVLLAAASAAALSGFAADYAAAQQVAQAGGLEEIVVTARRREENLQSVPVAVTAFSAERLRETNVNTVNDLSFMVPSLNVTNSVTRNAGTLAIRGISSAFQATRGATATYLNDVPVDATGPGTFFDLENVQVLKGPQGTAFGRSAIAGSILLVSKQPTSNFEGYVQGSIGNYNYREVEAAVNIPIADWLKVRIAAQNSDRDGFTKVLSTGERLDSRDYNVVRASVLFEPTDGISNLTTYTYRETDGTGTGATFSQYNPRALGGFFGFLYPNSAARLADQRALGPRQIRSISTPYTSDKSQFQFATNTTRVEIMDGLEVKNIFGFQLSKKRPIGDFDGLPETLLGTFPPPSEWTYQQQTLTEELQLHGNNFGGRFDWFAGWYWEWNKPVNEHIGGDVPNQIDFGDVIGCQKYGAAQAGALPPSLYTYNMSTSDGVGCTGNKFRSHGLYAQGQLDLSDWIVDGLKFTAGFRETWDRVENANEAYQLRPTGQITCNTAFADRNCRSVQNAAFHAPGYTVGFDWQFAPSKLVYVANRRAYKPGGVNGIDTAGNRLPNYNPETLTDVEVGFKGDWMLAGRPLRTNVSLYYGWYKNIQQNTTFFNPQTNIAQGLVANAATAITKGGEIEIQYLPTDDLSLALNYAKNSLKFDKFVGFDPVTLTLVDRSNEKFPYLLGDKVTGTVRYTLPISESIGQVAISTTWSWQGKQNFTPTPQPGGVEDPIVLGNARIDWNNVLGNPIDLSFFVNNIANRTYRVGSYTIYDSFGYSSDIWGEPRMWGFQLRYRFGS
jgi:iron complex outermembrane receptor protein